MGGLSGLASAQQCAHSVADCFLGDEVDRILGLELGADSYLTKPFAARTHPWLRALSRRVRLDKTSPSVDSRLVAGPIVLDLNTRRAFKRDTGYVGASGI